MSDLEDIRRPIPVILDTDIGDDIDDTWALAMMLRSPELDVKLITTDLSDTPLRAKFVARLLEVAGRTDIPVGIGRVLPGRQIASQRAWVADYDLACYPGKVHDDGVGALVETIMTAPEPITLICIGPVPNIAEALRREPRIATKVRFVGMHGSIRKGYGGSPAPAAEYNVKTHTPDCQAVFTAGWEMTITPLDTCGLVRLTGQKYAAVRDCADPLCRAVIENYRCWASRPDCGHDPDKASSVLFDTVAIYLAFAHDLVVLEDLPIRVTDDGHTVIDEACGKRVRCATAWRDLGAFEDLLVRRLTGR